MEIPLQFFKYLNKISEKIKNQRKSGMKEQLPTLLNLPETVVAQKLDNVLLHILGIWGGDRNAF